MILDETMLAMVVTRRLAMFAVDMLPVRTFADTTLNCVGTTRVAMFADAKFIFEMERDEVLIESILAVPRT